VPGVRERATRFERGTTVANHDGGRMLNHVISLLRRDGVFKHLGRSRSQQLVSEIVRWADHEHDCLAYEILEGHAAALGLCSDCLEPAKGLVEELCRKCRAELYAEEEGAVVECTPPKQPRRTSRRRGR
jgi:hypothetical protein